jgi:hypothetical protein
MKPPVQYAMMPPRVDAPKVGKMKPVEQPKIAKMRGFDLDYYLGPTGIPDRLRALNSMLNPVETLGGSMRASQRMLAPDTAPMGRVQAAGDMLSGVAGFAAPMVAASKVGVPAASAVADAFTGLSTGAQKAGATVVDRLNQPGPMPTLYSNPIPGLMGPKKGIKAYHGSPHSFDKFSMDAIGTGEGAQAYGHGLYFAENEGVARGYRENLSFGAKIDGKPLYTPDDAAFENMPDSQRWIERNALDTLSAHNYDPVKALADGGASYADDPKLWADVQDRIKELSAQGEISAPGSMYEVNINADPADFLDWDKPLSEQPQKVRDALAQFGITYDAQAARQYDDALLDALMNDANRPLPKQPSDPTGGAIYENSRLVPGAYRDPVAAGMALKEKGIPGIRYLDAGSRGAGDGSRNFVVFDDSLIDIIRKYGIAGLMMGGMMQPNQAQAGQ